MMSAADALRALSARHRAFVQAYCTNGFNATQAALVAGYSERSAASRGHELVRNREIREAIRAVLDEALMTPEELKARIADDALATIEPFVQVTMGGGIQFDFASEHARASMRWIKKLTITPTESGDKVAIELVDAQKAKDQLIKVFGLHEQKVAVTTDTVEVVAYYPDDGRERDGED
jgi:phage terminase small subunit